MTAAFRSMALISAAGVLAACGAHGGSAAKQFPLPQIGPVLGIAAGPDGRMWFTQTKSRSIGAVSAGGTIQMYQNPPDIDADPQRISAGPDGAMWFTQVSPHEPVDSGPDMIGRITVGGVWSEYPIPSWDALPQGIAAGPDGAMWFAERHANAIGRIAMNGKIKEYVLPHAGSGPTGITRGSDGKMWFTEGDAARIGRIDPSTHAIVEFTTTVAKSHPGPIAASSDGFIYFIEVPNRWIARVSTTGKIGEFPTGEIIQPGDLAASADGTLWFTDMKAGAIGHFAPHQGLTFISVGDKIPYAIAAGPDNTIWFSVQKGPSFSYTGTGAIGVLDVSRNP